MSGPASPPSLPTIAAPGRPGTSRLGPIRFTAVADPTGAVDRSDARVVPAERLSLPLSVVRVFRATGLDANGNQVVSQADYVSAMASAAEQLSGDLDRAVAGVGPGRHALAGTADFEDTFADPAGADIIGQPADRVDLTVRVTATVTAVDLRDLERAALAQLGEALPAGLALAAGSMSARVTGALASGECVIYTVEASGLAAPEAGGLASPAVVRPAAPAAAPSVGAAADARSLPSATAATADDAADRPWTTSKLQIWAARAIGLLLGLAIIGYMLISRPPV